MDIYAPLAPAQEHRTHQWGHLGCLGSCKWSAREAQEFVGCAGAVPASQSCLAAAPAKMSLIKGKNAAPGVGGCNAMKGLTIMSFPAQTEKNARDCLKIICINFHGPSKRLESGCTDIEPQEIP